MTALEIILIILIILFVGGVIAWRVYARVRGKKKGAAPDCGCSSCSNCASGGACSRASDPNENFMKDIHEVSEVSCDLSDVAEQIKARKK